jgi:hypothetical protein
MRLSNLCDHAAQRGGVLLQVAGVAFQKFGLVF